jgi:hypothetical protein
MNKTIIIFIIIILFNQLASAQKKTPDSVLLKEYYKTVLRSMEKNLDQLENYSNNSISFLYIQMINYKLKGIIYDAVDSSAIALFKESKLENLDTLYAKICRIYGSPNCTIVQPVSIENGKEVNPDSKITNTPDIRKLPVFYNSFDLKKDPKYLMELIKIEFWGKHH